MQAVILAAGRGTRMGALTENVPKPMLSLMGKPMLEWKLAMLPEAIDEVILVIGYLGEQIENYFGTEWNGRKMTYVRQDVLNGSAGSIHCAKDVIKGSTLVTMGDDLYHSDDLNDLLKEDSAILGLEVTHAEPFGLIEVTPEGNLLKTTERPHGRLSGLVNTGAYLLRKEFFDYPMVPISETEYGLPQTLVSMGKDFAVKVRNARAWQPVGCPDDLLLGEDFLRTYCLDVLTLRT